MEVKMFENINYIDIILTIIALLIGVVALRVNIAFDVNDWLKERKKIKLTKLQNICPHVSIFKKDENLQIQSDFESPPGTLKWQCSTCGMIANNVDESHIQYWLKNPKDLIKRKELLQKEMKKAGYV